MSFLKAFGRYLGLRATRAELRKLTDTVRSISSHDVHLVFDAFQNSKDVLDGLLMVNHQLTFRSALALDIFHVDDELRRDIAILGRVLTAAQRQFNEPMHAFGVYFWRVVLIVMIYPELYESGRDLWRAIASRKTEYVEGKTRFITQALEKGTHDLGPPAMSVQDAVEQGDWLLSTAPKYYTL